MPRRRLVACDTGPLVALYDRSDQYHKTCVEAARTILAPLLTIWPVITEALYLLGSERGAADKLLEQVEQGHLEIIGPDGEDVHRIRELMSRYEDLPMDFADAALVAACERRKVQTIFTTDRRDFTVYKPIHRRRFEIVP